MNNSPGLMKRFNELTWQKSQAVRKAEEMEEAHQALKWLFDAWDGGMNGDDCFADCPFDLERICDE